MAYNAMKSFCSFRAGTTELCRKVIQTREETLSLTHNKLPFHEELEALKHENKLLICKVEKLQCDQAQLEELEIKNKEPESELKKLQRNKEKLELAHEEQLKEFKAFREEIRMDHQQEYRYMQLAQRAIIDELKLTLAERLGVNHNQYTRPHGAREQRAA